MKILGYILLASLTCALSACEKDEILPEPEPPVVTPGMTTDRKGMIRERMRKKRYSSE